MITQIKKVKDFGSYVDFSWDTELNDFSKYNLFYGWNGSGKTTLSKLFYLLQNRNDNILEDENRDLIDGFDKYSFQFLLDDNTYIDEKNFTSNNLNIHIFNEVFVKKNIDWDNVIKSLLLISSEKITEKQELDESEKNKKDVDKKLDVNLENSEKIDIEIDKFFRDHAKKIKEKFKVIDTSDKYYFNYDKRKLEAFVKNNLVRVSSKESILPEEEVDKLTTSIKPNILNEIPLPDLDVELEYLNKVRTQVLDILKTSLVVKEIQRLKENPQISNWVEKGIAFHSMGAVCEFCGNNVSKERLDEIEKHFSNDFKLLKAKLEQAIDWLPSQKICFDKLADDYELYDEFRRDYKTIKNDFLIELNNINNIFDQWLAFLKEKENNPFEIIEFVEEIKKDKLVDYNNSSSALRSIIESHNNKTKNFSIITKGLKEKLELHYAAEEYQKLGIKKRKTEKNKLDSEIALHKKEKLELDKKIDSLKALLSDEAFGAKEFNNKLHKFISRDDLSLRFNKSKNGYEILRAKKKANNLSEGEKTAIAFIYFITKLKENDNNLDESIIIVDDPISSFDSNHLFSAYAFLKNECEHAKQLFVLTHNFAYYKLIRDWFKPDHKRTSIYTLEAKKDDTVRTSKILNAKNSLTKYQSEYHYIFSTLYTYKDEEFLDISNAFLIGNLSRKLLEAFFSFKYPKKRNDFKSLMDDGISDKELLEKVYKFINKYSHNQNIEFYDSSDDNILAESSNIVNDILVNIIKNIDENHYHEMVELVQN